MAIAAQCSPDSGRDLALNLQLVMQQLLLFISPKLVQTSSKLNLFNGSSFQYAQCEVLIIVRSSIWHSNINMLNLLEELKRWICKILNCNFNFTNLSGIFWCILILNKKCCIVKKLPQSKQTKKDVEKFLRFGICIGCSYELSELKARKIFHCVTMLMSTYH